MADTTIHKESPITVRPATRDDVPAIRAVAERTWRATYTGQIPEPDIEAFLAAHYSYERLAQRVVSGFYVAERDGAMIGYAQVGIDSEGRAELFALYVLPEAHGIGAGWRLWQQALAYVRAMGQGTMLVWVLDTNHTARRFYERQGARFVNERAFSVGDDVIMEVGYQVSVG
jgi:ribosomal protein S18 acetylase RimI-like enzyme